MLLQILKRSFKSHLIVVINVSLLVETVEGVESVVVVRTGCQMLVHCKFKVEVAC